MLLVFGVLGGDRACLLARSRTDPDAFAGFYDAYADQVLGYLAARVLDVEIAFDISSETFAIALRRRNQFRGSTPEEEKAWLYAIATSELHHYWRKGRIEKRALDRIGVPVVALSDPALERIEERLGVLAIAAQLQEEVDCLPEEQRRAVMMRVVDERSYETLSSELGVTTQVARARVSRGLRALAARLRDRGIALEDVA